MERVYWRYKLESTYFYQPQSILTYFFRNFLYSPLDFLLFYQDEPAVLKELYTDTIIDFSMHHATVEEHGKERDIYSVRFQIPDTNVYYSRNLHYLNDPNQRLTQVDEVFLKEVIGNHFFYIFKFYRDWCFKRQYQLIENYFNYLYQIKKSEDDQIAYLIEHNGPKPLYEDRWEKISRYVFFFSSKNTHIRKNIRMQKRNERIIENSNKFVKRFFEEHKD